MNRRRMTGHRVVSGGAPPGPATSVRAPWSVYETNDGVSATGNGPTLTSGGLGAGPEALFGYGDAAAPPGVNIASGDFSIGFFREINADSLTTGEGAVALFLTVSADNGVADPRLQFILENYDAQAILHLLVYTVGGSEGEIPGQVNLEGVAVGRHLFSLSVSAGIGQLFMDGVAVGSPFPFAPGLGNQGDLINLENMESFDNGFASQLIFANVGYTEAEWLYIYNGGAGRAYSTWSITP
jgi:hypothetical protein